MQERTKDWQSRYGPCLNMTCMELTGDSSQAEMHAIDDADIICTTPEKFGRWSCPIKSAGLHLIFILMTPFVMPDNVLPL